MGHTILFIREHKLWSCEVRLEFSSSHAQTSESLQLTALNAESSSNLTLSSDGMLLRILCQMSPTSDFG